MIFSGRLKIKLRVWFVFVAIFLAVLIYYFNWDKILTETVQDLGVFGPVFAGAFYTFGLTTPTAFLILIESMHLGNYIFIAFVASLAAALTDTFLFMLVKDQLEKNASKIIKKIRKKFGNKNFILSIIGFFLFGSPLPDELALAFMQIGKIEPVRITIIVFCAKFLTLIITYKAMYG